MEPSSTKERLFRDCVSQVYKHRVRSLLSTFAFSFLPAVIGWQENTRTVTIIYVICMWLYTFVNVLLSRRVSRSVLDNKSAVFWSWMFHLQLVFFGLLLDSLFLYLDSQHVPGAMRLLMFATAGFSAGAVATYNYLKWAGPLLVVTAVIPQLVYLALQWGGSGIIIDVGLVIFIVFMTIVNMELHQNTVRALTVGYELEAARKDAETRALTDTLTGLQNRRAFFETAPHLLATARRMKRPVSLLMMDLDDFKGINDGYGHAMGDKALTSVANTVKAIARESDIAARLGGEEFAILLPDTPVDGGRQMAERLRTEIRNIDLSSHGLDIRLSASLGVAGYDEQCDSIDRLLEHADEALYTAKSMGRNRTEVFRPDSD